MQRRSNTFGSLEVDEDSFGVWLEENVGDYTRPHPDEYLVDCPKCDAKKRCSINPEKRVVCCYKCGGQRLFDWAKELYGISPSDMVRVLLGFSQRDVNLANFDQTVERITVPETKIEETSQEEVAEEARRFFHPIGYSGEVDQIAAPFLIDRGFTLEHARAYRLMLAMGGTWSARIIIPAITNGSMAYFQGRTIAPGVEPKYLNPGSRHGMYRNQHIFNLDLVAQHQPKTVYLCEGAFNAMSAGWNSLALFGKHLSPDQFRLLRERFPKDTLFVISFDYGTDRSDGRKRSEIYDAAILLLSYFNRVGYVVFDSEEDLNDILCRHGYAAVQEVLGSTAVVDSTMGLMGLLL